MGTDRTVCLWRPPPAAIDVFARAGLDAVRSRLEGVGDLGPVVVHLTLRMPPVGGVVPFRSRPVALVTLPAENEAAVRALGTLPGRLEVFHTDVAEPQPSSGRACPCMLTLFEKRADLSRETFLARWHGEHTPMAIEIHPSIGYVRHVVRDRAAGAGPWDGIVVEEFAEARDITTMRLFGDGLRALWNAARVGLHVRTFLRLGSLETYLVERRTL